MQSGDAMAHATTVNPDDLARLVRREHEALVRHLVPAREGGVAGVHRARVASRRLRELVPVLEAALGRRLPGVRRDLRRVTRALGPVRELDVTRLLLTQLWRGRDWPASVLARVDRTCANAREQRRREMTQRLAHGEVPDLARRLAALSAAVVASGDGSRATAHLATRLRRRAADLVAALDDVGTVYAAPPIHAVRIAAKKLRYTLEIGAATAGLPVAESLKALKAVQELLGGLNDRQIVQQWMHATAAERGVGRQAIRTIDAAQAFVETACRRRHARFLRRQPALRELAVSVGRDAALELLAGRPTPTRMQTPAGSPPRRSRAAGGASS
jgi:CHAD domain-containing protein